MLIIGHRVNTLSSLKKIEVAVDMIEVDLRWRNGQIILSHDRPVGHANPDSLEQLLQIYKSPLNLEIKQSGFEALLLEKIKDFSSEVLISSKYPSILKKIRALDEKIKLGMILGSGNFFLLPFIRKFDTQLGLYSIHPKNFLARKTIVKYLKQLDKKIFVWTVNSAKQLQRLKTLEVDGVFTDYPDKIDNQYDESYSLQSNR